MNIDFLPTRLKLLQKIGNGQNVSQKLLAQELDVSEARVSQLVKDINEKGEDDDYGKIIEVDRSSRPYILYLTDSGKRFTGTKLIEELEDRTPQKALNSNLSPVGERGLLKWHNHTIEVSIQNTDDLINSQRKWFSGDDWFNSWMEEKKLEFEEDKVSQSYLVNMGGYVLRFTREKVFIQLGHFYGRDARELGNRVMREGREAVEFLNSRTPVKAESKFGTPMFKVNQQEIAIVREAFAEIVVEHPETDLRDFRVFDEEGNLRMWIDNSDGERHLETGTPNHFAEDDLHFYKDEVIGWSIQHKDEWRGLKRLMESDSDVARIPLRLDVLESKVEGISEQVQRNRDEFYERMGDQNNRIKDAVDRVESVQGRQAKITDVVSEVAERSSEIEDEVQGVKRNNVEVLSQMIDLQERVQDSLEADQEAVVKEQAMLNVMESQFTHQVSQGQRVKRLESKMDRKDEQITDLLGEVKHLREEANTGFMDKVKGKARSVKNTLSSKLKSFL